MKTGDLLLVRHVMDSHRFGLASGTVGRSRVRTVIDFDLLIYCY